jgi:hypothetical protein
MSAHREALERISRLRPAGDVETCKNPRKLVEQIETIALAALSTPSEQFAKFSPDAESLGLRIAERIRQEMTSGRQWWLDSLSLQQRVEFEGEIASTCVAVCEDECTALSQTLPAPGEVATAVELLEQYAGFIRSDVKADDLERHPYLPLIEQTIASLATVAAANDEGVESIRRAIWGYVNAQPEDAATLSVVQFLANRDVFLSEAIALATSRSQHEGAER